MSKRWLVVGGGFRGIIGAYLLALKGHEVVLLERDAHLGGPLYATEWKGFYLDRGCNAFDNDSDEDTSILLDLLGGEFVPVTVTYASVTNGVKTDGISIPNLGAYGIEAARRILYELVEAASRPEPKCRTLHERLCARFGPTAGGYISDAVRKIYRDEASAFEADAFDLTPFRRIKFLDDSGATLLKESATLDGLVAASSQDDPLKFYRDRTRYPFRLFYPAEHGMRGFCERAERRLGQLQVAIVTGQDIERLAPGPGGATATLSSGKEVVADQVLWCSGLETLASLLGYGDAISRYVHRVPMVLYYFVIEKGSEGPYSYVQNFDQTDMFHRASVPGSYGPNMCAHGFSYVCAEVPTVVEKPEWKNPDDFIDVVWAEMRRYGVVRGDRPVETLAVKTPVSYRLPRVGYAEAVADIVEAVKSSTCIVGADRWEFAKSEIIRSVRDVIERAG